MKNAEPPEIDREELIRRWLREIGDLDTSAEAAKLLTRCRTKAVLELVVAFISTPGWIVFDERSFASPDFRLVLQPEIAGHTVDVLLENRHLPETVAFDLIEDRAPVFQREPGADPRADDIRAVVGEYRLVPVRELNKATYSISEKLEQIMQRVPEYSSERFAINLNPGLVWRRLREGFDFAGVKPSARRLQLLHWLREQGISLPDPLLHVLARCVNHAEVKFLLPILRAVPWRTSGGGRVMSGAIGVWVKAPVGRGVIDFVVGRLESRTQPPTAIHIAKPAGPYRRSGAGVAATAEMAAREAGYGYIEVQPDDAASEGRSWADLLKSAIEERDVLREKFATDPEDRGEPPQTLS